MNHIYNFWLNDGSWTDFFILNECCYFQYNIDSKCSTKKVTVFWINFKTKCQTNNELEIVFEEDRTISRAYVTVYCKCMRLLFGPNNTYTVVYVKHRYHFLNKHPEYHVTQSSFKGGSLRKRPSWDVSAFCFLLGH